MTKDILIFDMDGTLYFSDSFIENYIKFLTKDETRQQKMLDEYHQITKEFKTAGHTTFTYSDKPLGDVWQILFYIAHKYDISVEENHQAFIKTREQMINGREILINENLNETIKKLKMPKVLMTNSPEISATPFIEYLDLDGVFDMYIYDAKKPFSMGDHVEIIKKKYPGSNIIKIGDNLHNDIQSSNEIGIGSIYINHFNNELLNEVTLHSLDQLNEYLKQKYMEV